MLLDSKQYNIRDFSSWSPSGSNYLIIAGPCAAESEKQLLKTAEAIAPNIHIFRAGLWKARTQIDAFKGMGKSGLKSLVKIKETFNIPVITEALNKNHINLIYDSGLKYVWLGARTTVNPFLTDEIAQALYGKDMCVFVKNPIIPDFSLWLNTIERINNSGIDKIATIHRGFQSLNTNPYRNIPLWEMPIKLKCTIPNLPILCDPSHIAGNVSLIENIILKALSLDMSGFMLETHFEPRKALSDNKQQLYPSRLKSLLKIVNRHNNSADDLDTKLLNKQISNLREIINTLDETILSTLSKRFSVSTEIGKLKRKAEIPSLQVSRWKDLLKDRITLGEELGIPGEFVEKLMEIIHYESLRLQ